MCIYVYKTFELTQMLLKFFSSSNFNEFLFSETLVKTTQLADLNFPFVNYAVKNFSPKLFRQSDRKLSYRRTLAEFLDEISATLTQNCLNSYRYYFSEYF